MNSRSIVYFFDPNYGIRSQNSSSLKSNTDRKDAHIQLHDFNPENTYHTTNITTNKRTHDDDSEKGLIIKGRAIGITKTTNVDVTHH